MSSVSASVEKISPVGSPPFGVHEGERWRTDYKISYVSISAKRVFVPLEWVASEGNEERIAAFLADAGYDVVLRVENGANRSRTSDAFVFVGETWEAWEFKSLTDRTNPHHELTNLRNAVQSDLRLGKRQAATIVIHLSREIASLGGMAQVNAGVGSALRMDSQNLIQRVVLLSLNGKIIEQRTREELNNESFFSNF